jgi:hypothetical protein
MPVYLWQGKVLTVDGKVAVDEACCCIKDLCATCTDCLTFHISTPNQGETILSAEAIGTSRCARLYEDTARMRFAGEVIDPSRGSVDLKRVRDWMFIRIIVGGYYSDWQILNQTETHNPPNPTNCVLTEFIQVFTLHFVTGPTTITEPATVTITHGPLCDHAKATGGGTANIYTVQNLPVAVWPLLPPAANIDKVNGDEWEKIETGDYDLRLTHEAGPCKYIFSIKYNDSGTFNVGETITITAEVNGGTPPPNLDGDTVSDPGFTFTPGGNYVGGGGITEDTYVLTVTTPGELGTAEASVVSGSGTDDVASVTLVNNTAVGTRGVLLGIVAGEITYEKTDCGGPSGLYLVTNDDTGLLVPLNIFAPSEL